MGAIERHLKGNALIRHSQHKFMKGNSCLTDLVSFCDKVTWLVDEWKAVNEFFWILVRYLMLSLTALFWTSHPTAR